MVVDTPNRSGAARHTTDTDCTVDSRTDTCTACGVHHGDPCPDCQGRAFHNPGCPLQTKIDTLNAIYREGKADGRSRAGLANNPERMDCRQQDGVNETRYTYMLGYVQGWNEVVEARDIASENTR